MEQFERVANHYSSMKNINEPNRILYVRWLKECGKIKGKRALDAGCGGGYSSRKLAEKGAIVSGFDSSRRMIKLAREEERKMPMGIRYFLADASRLGKVGSFDLVTATFVICHAVTEKKLRLFFRNFAKNLKSGGRLVAIDCNPETPTTGYQKGSFISREWVDRPFGNCSRIRTFFHDAEGKRACSVINHYFSRKTTESALEDAGFSGIEWIDFSGVKPTNGDMATAVILKARLE